MPDPEPQPELVDNRDRYGHREALEWMAAHRPTALSVATGYVRIGGLAALATLGGPADRPVRLLLGAMPEPGLGAEPAGIGESRLASDRFRETLERLREERDHDAFPPARRSATLDLVEAFIQSEHMQVRRFTTRFLHGKCYLFADRADERSLAGEGAVLVSSANLTSGGLQHNLELGAARYDPSAVVMALDWFDELWNEADEFKQDLLDLLYPPEQEYDPETIYWRALIELYGDELEAETGGDIRAGGLTLTRFQEDGYRRAKRILERFGGVIYADGVGTGKTTIGLRFIEEYAKERGQHAVVVAPAQLRESLWQKEIHGKLLPAQVISYQELASDRQFVPGGGEHLLLNKDVYRLIVIDEAHAFRNADNTWYAALDQLLGGPVQKHVVLLTATPVNNSLWDLYNLVLLFARHDAAFRTELGIPSLKELIIAAGGRDPDLISEDQLFPLVDAVGVRRDRRFIQDHYSEETLDDGTPIRFPEPVLLERRYDLDTVYPGVFTAVVDAISSLTMARYVPAKYERGPGAAEAEKRIAQDEALAGLMQSQLLKRFESSAHAARETLRRMILAHEVLVEAWTSRDQVPSLRTLKELVLADQDGEPLSDVVATALDDDVEAKPASAFDERFVADVTADLERLRAIADRLDHLATLPDPKLVALEEILTQTPASKVAIFTTYADTARYLAEALETDPDRFGSREMAVVVGSETDSAQRTRQLERFAPHSSTGDETFVPDDGEVDLLLATDILSEGQNLQDAQAVVSFDMPWNPQRVVQRNGRIIRLKSPHDQVFLFTMLPKAGDLEAALRLEARVRGKIAAANASFGMESQVLSAVDAESKAFADLEEFFERLATGDQTVIDEGQGPGSAAFSGEAFRRLVSRLLQEGTFQTIRRLPWGIGSAFRHPDLPSDQTGVFFACRTKSGERLWRFVSKDGTIVREDLEMLRRIDPGDAPREELLPGFDLEAAWHIAAEDICAEYNRKLDPKLAQSALPASQRWALEILRNPDLPDEAAYSRADEALGVGRNQLVRRAISDIRRRTTEEPLSSRATADELVALVDHFGLRPEPPAPESAQPITEADLGVVCYMALVAR